jgi:hypothetical protein
VGQEVPSAIQARKLIVTINRAIRSARPAADRVRQAVGPYWAVPFHGPISQTRAPLRSQPSRSQPGGVLGAEPWGQALGQPPIEADSASNLGDELAIPTAEFVPGQGPGKVVM